MRLIVDEKHSDVVNEALAKAQGKARERKVDDWNELLKLVTEAADDLPSIPKVAMAGSQLTLRIGAGVFPSCYHGIPMGTVVSVVFRKDGKVEVITIDRGNVNRKRPVEWKMTGRAKAAILKEMDIMEESL